MDKKLLNTINNRQLVSVMNQTKWRELCDDFAQLRALKISVRYKLVTGEVDGFSPVWWDELFEYSPQIEWIEFNPIVKEYRGRLVTDNQVDRSEEILNVFRKHSIRYSKEQSHFKVWGYLSPETIPDFI